MIQKMFEKYLLSAFNSFNKQVSDYFIENKNILEQHTQEIKKIKDVLTKKQNIYGTVSSDCLISNVCSKEETIQILNDTLLKDYFTGEFINKEAKTTKELYLIHLGGKKIEVVYYKGDNDGVEQVGGKNVYFIL